jgi:hypothetical protein
MMNKRYRVTTKESPASALERVAHLLSSEGVSWTRSDEVTLRSTRMPIALHTLQSVLYSRKNWFGMNPFTYVSGVQIRCEPEGIDTTTVSIDIDRSRGFFWVVFWIACCAVGVPAAPQPAGALLLLVGSGVLWLFVLSFVGGYLIKEEIRGALRRETS